MHTDNDLGSTGVNASMDSEDENQEKNLEWLLDMDMSEPEESLFTVTGNEYHDEGLSAYEAEVAGRPLTRGNAASDDLSTYVGEEIVISSDSARSDIYADGAGSAPAEDEAAAEDEVMAIDYSLGRQKSEDESAASVDEGVDILGLVSDDDMGEKFLSIKRVKKPSTAPVESADSAEPARVSSVERAEAAKTAAITGSVAEEKQQQAEVGATDETVAAADDFSGFEMSTDIEDEATDSLDIEFSVEDIDLETEEEIIEVSAEDAVEEIAEDLTEEVLEGEDELSLEFDIDVPPEMNLTEAPVPTLVANPALDQVANEGPVPAEDDGGDGFAQSGYMASLGDAEDEGEFEKLLAGSEHLLGGDASLEELTIQPEEGLLSVDPDTDFSIDYHEDFHSMEGFSEGSVAEITTIIAPVMEEITRRAQVRAEELGLAADAVNVDVMFGSDEESIKHCYAEGYEPVFSICSELPAPLLELDASERDSVYVRLRSAENNENWNDLFSPDFVAFGDSVGGAVSSEADTDEQGIEFDLSDFEDVAMESGTEQEAQLGQGFGDDIFGEGFADDFGADFGSAESAITSDIEDVFSDLSAEQAESDAVDDVALDMDFDVADEQVVEESEEELLQVQDQPEEEVEELVAETVEESPVVETEIEAGLQVQGEQPLEEVAAADESGMAWCIPDNIEFSYTSASGAEIFADFLDAFIEEGSEEVEKLENIIGEWEKDITADEPYADVARTLHTIKGIAKGVGLQRYGTLVHNFETLLEALPRPQADDAQMYFRIVNAWLDAVVRGIEFVTEQRVDITSEVPVSATVAEEVEQAEQTEQEPSMEESLEAINERKSTVLAALEKKRDQKLADEGAKVLAAQQSVRITSEKLDHLLNLASQAQQLGVRASQNTSRSKRSSAELQGRLTSVRSHIGKIADRALLNVNAKNGGNSADLDALEMDQYSELQEAASILREGVEDLADLVDVVSRQNSQIEALLKQQSSVISSISSSVQGARVVPMSRLMPGLRRIVRTVSNDLGKVVNFKVLNETGALDRDHYARLQVVMEHMVRNAMDHGIESPDDRVGAGKPSGGRITVDVRKSGGDYVIRLSDDGKGIDPDAIRQSALEKGLDIDVDALSDDEIIRLIFNKGFTTADSVSEISGRGVGMDIVLTELQQIGGDIQIKSAIGLGTTFEVRIPSNVSVNGALLVAAGDESYAIPLNGLIAVEQVPVDEFYEAVENGTALSLFDIECEPAYLPTLCQGLGLPDRNVWDAFVPVIIAGDDDRKMAIAIDNVEEALELVVRSLGSQFTSVPGVAGAATTADGEAIVALDLNLLVASVGIDGIASVEVTQTEDTRMLALVVDDSRTQRMVATSQLDTVGVETITAENGLVAIDLLNSAHRLPDVVLLDVEMPVKDGIETLREIRKSRRYGHLPVIMVTSRTGAKHRALAKEAGCNAYMGKPFNFPALIGQINDLTGYDLQLS